MLGTRLEVIGGASWVRVSSKEAARGAFWVTVDGRGVTLDSILGVTLESILGVTLDDILGVTLGNVGVTWGDGLV